MGDQYAEPEPGSGHHGFCNGEYECTGRSSRCTWAVLIFDLTDEEVVHMNNYCVGTSEITGKSYERIEPEVAGTYHLNGVQAVSYTRIRYTAGNDYKRTERQRELIAKIVAKAKKADMKDTGRHHGQCVPDDLHQSQQIGYCISGNEYVVLSAGGYLRIPV